MKKICFCNLVALVLCMPIIRKTKSVKALLTSFEHSDNAISVKALIKQLHQKMNKTTVYRILERLEEDGIIHSFMDKDGLKWYARCSNCSPGHHTDSHPHFQCSDCGKIECLTFEVKIPSLPNHKIQSTNFLLIGECAECSL